MSDYHTHISAKHNIWQLGLKETWQYRDLIWLMTERRFKVSYKQTILGPLWLFITPLMTSIVYVVLFGNIAKLSTDGVPQLLFYLTGTALWNYFSSCLSDNASIFSSNAGLFGKVYFPRLVMPFSSILCAVIKFGIQIILVVMLLAYYCINGMLHPHWFAWLLIPAILLVLGLLGMGIGIILTSITVKYRDLKVLISFGVQLWMFITPVVYPMSSIKAGWLNILLSINPVTAPMEIFRYAVLGVGTIEWLSVIVSIGTTLVFTFMGIILFNRVERNFMDII